MESHKKALNEKIVETLLGGNWHKFPENYGREQ